MNITITQIQDAIIKALKNAFEKVNVESYDPKSDLSLLAPACLLDVEYLPLGQCYGDGRYPVNARISIHCVLGLEVKNINNELREFAMSVSQFVFENGYWMKGSVASKPTDIVAYPGNFKKDTVGGYDSWIVSWQQELSLGSSKWTAAALRSGIRLAINPVDDSNPDEYKPIEVLHAPSD